MQVIIKIRDASDVDFLNGVDFSVEILKPGFWFCDHETNLPIISTGYVVSLHPETDEHRTLIQLKFGDRMGITIV